MIDKKGTLRRLTAALAAIPTTMVGTDGAALAASWTAALATALGEYTAALAADLKDHVTDFDDVRASYLDQLDFDLQEAIAEFTDYYTSARAEYIENSYNNIAADAAHAHSRSRVYPQDASAVIQITADAAADTWGAWTEIIPINTVDFKDGYMIPSFVMEEAGAGATYIVQLGYSTVDADDPTITQILGERRVRTIGTPIKSVHADYDIYSGHAPKNAKLWGRIQSSSINADTMDISVVVLRHFPITNHIAHVATWPWAT